MHFQFRVCLSRAPLPALAGHPSSLGTAAQTVHAGHRIGFHCSLTHAGGSNAHLQPVLRRRGPLWRWWQRQGAEAWRRSVNAECASCSKINKAVTDPRCKGSSGPLAAGGERRLCQHTDGSGVLYPKPQQSMLELVRSMHCRLITCLRPMKCSVPRTGFPGGMGGGFPGGMGGGFPGGMGGGGFPGGGGGGGQVLLFAPVHFLPTGEAACPRVGLQGHGNEWDDTAHSGST